MKLSEKLSNSFVHQNIILEQEKETYQFGIEQACFQLLDFLVTIMVGLLMKELQGAVIFIAVYIVLRKYAGGWHASTQTRCFWFSTALIVIALLIIKALPLTVLALTLLIVPGAVIIFILSPVADANKPLSKNEHRVYGRRARTILVIILAATVVLAFFHMLTVIACIGTAISTLAFMLVLGLIKNKGKALIEESPEGDE